ncbi:MAG: DUF5606 domain-containing protein [Chitinophagales bacterium]
MLIKDIVAISGMQGLYKSETQKVNGMIVTSLTEGWTKFVSSRQNLFSPLENISIYTDADSIQLADVLLEVHKQKDTNPLVDAKAKNEEVRAWFLKIVPNHDVEKVYISDIKKLIKWYEILAEKGVIENELQERLKDTKEADGEKDAVKEKAD